MTDTGNISNDTIDIIIESCKPLKRRGRPSYKRQLSEIKDEGKLNLESSESILAITNLKSILSLESFESLPNECKRQLVKLLPDIDQVNVNGSLTPSETSLSNHHFARFCEQYTERLAENKLKPEAIEKRKNETTKELCKLDPWKLKNYEPIWGQKLISHSIEDLELERYGQSVANASKEKRS